MSKTTQAKMRASTSGATDGRPQLQKGDSRNDPRGTAAAARSQAHSTPSGGHRIASQLSYGEDGRANVFGDPRRSDDQSIAMRSESKYPGTGGLDTIKSRPAK